MGIVIGMDEAGYGPNLGPLVITATVWQVPGDPREFDFWSTLASVVSQTRPKKNDERLHVADSKQVHSPARGLRDLERSIRPLLSLAGAPLGSFQKLGHWLIGLDEPDVARSPFALPNEPWFAEGDLELPVVTGRIGTARETAVSRQTTGDLLHPPSGRGGREARVAGEGVTLGTHDSEPELALPARASRPSQREGEGPPAESRLREVCDQAGLRFLEARSEVVLTERFNEMTSRYDSKGVALSKTTFGLLGKVWDSGSDEPTLIIGDKHGGRNRYDDLIGELLDGQMIFRLRESREKSSYRVGASELHFQTGAEAHFPVAVASMICRI